MVSSTELEKVAQWREASEVKKQVWVGILDMLIGDKKEFLIQIHMSHLNIDLKLNSEIWSSDTDLRLLI